MGDAIGFDKFHYTRHALDKDVCMRLMVEKLHDLIDTRHPPPTFVDEEAYGPTLQHLSQQ